MTITVAAELSNEDGFQSLFDTTASSIETSLTTINSSFVSKQVN